MRILAIRGENLASLAGAFEVDLTAPPLDTAGIFAITGPTGAGKSTLLDALCVALFDRTPRLSDQGGVEVGDGTDRLRAHDVRSLLRKGASHGSASVDFIGVDGSAYTATWKVDRGKRNGKLNDQVLSLHPHRDPTVLLAGGKTRKRDALVEIEKRLGLSFDEFRQAALLAQGDFAAFLKADQKHRASLLERITGTRIYTKLSQKAHERAREERQKLDQLSRDQAGISVLSASERDALIEDETRLKDEESKLTQESLLVEGWLAWHRTLAQLEASENEARDALVHHENAWNSAEPLRARLSKYRAHQALLPLLQRVDEAAREETESTTQLSLATAEKETAQTTLTHTTRAKEDAELAESVSQSEAEQLQPEMERASKLDGEISAARRQHEERQLAQKRAEQEATTEETIATELKSKLDDESSKLTEAETWLAQREDRRELSTQWSQWSVRIDAYVELISSRAKLSPDAAAERVKQAELHASETAAANETATSAQRMAQALVDEAEKQVTLAEREVSPEKREGLLELERRLRLLDEARQEAQTAADKRAEVMELLRKAERDVKRSTEKQLNAEAQRNQVNIELEAAEKSLDQSRLRHELNGVRERLKEGEACPVCGSLDHPDRTTSEEIATLFEEYEKLVREKKNLLIERERDVASAQTAADEQRKRARDREEEAKKLTQTQEAATTRYDRLWNELRFDDLEAQPTAPEAAERIASRRQVIAADLEALQMRERAAAQARNDAAQARRNRDQARAEAEAARRNADEATRALDEAKRNAHDIETELARITQYRRANTLAWCVVTLIAGDAGAASSPVLENGEKRGRLSCEEDEVDAAALWP
ncbi:MAG: AAA family ATPase [Polyangiaceae bacterium]